MGCVCYSITIYIFIVLIIPICKGESYYFINTTKTWTEAKQYCEDRKGTLAYGDIDNITAVIPIGKSAFIGIVQVKAWIWMAGCYSEGTTGHLDIIRKGQGLKETSQLSFSECMILCYQSEYIAVEQRKNQNIFQYSCYCLNSTRNLKERKSSVCVKCNNVNKYCGFNNSLSLYQLDYGQTVKYISTESQQCFCGSVLLFNNGLHYRGQSCNDRLHVVYQTNYGPNTLYSSENANFTWNEAFDRAPSNNVLLQKKDLKEPILKQRFKDNPIERLWFGLFQTIANISVTEIVNGMEYTCGRNIYSQTKFTDCNSIRSYFVCQANDLSDTFSKFTNVIDTTSVSTIRHYEEEQNSLFNTLLVACTVGGLMIFLFAIGVAFYIAKRRKTNQRRTDPRKEQENEYAAVEPFIQNPNPEITDKSTKTAADNGEYDVFCKKGSRRDTDGPNEDLYDHARAPADESSYDFTSNVQKIKTVDNTYDHTPNVLVTNTGAGAIDDYDHVEISQENENNQ